MALTRALVVPLLSLPGALYPPGPRPAWLTALARLGPIARLACPVRPVAGGRLSGFPAAITDPVPGRHVRRMGGPSGVSLGLVPMTGAALLLASMIMECRRPEKKRAPSVAHKSTR
jgi:hypothetical protein